MSTDGRIYARKLGKENAVLKISLQMMAKLLFPTGLKQTGSEFERVGAATEKAPIPMFVSLVVLTFY